MPLELRRIEQAHRSDALTLVCPDLEASYTVRVRRDGQRNENADDVLIGAYRGNSLVGAVRGDLLAGGIAAVWPPGLTEDEPESTATKLLEALDVALGRRPTVLAQSLVPVGQIRSKARLRASKYIHATDLLSLISPVGRDSHPAVSDFDLVPFESSRDRRLTSIIHRTFEGTLDCPWLSGLVGAQAFVEGFAASAQFCPGNWLLLRSGVQHVGCLLLSHSTAPGTTELLYMGLVPEVRRRGWGRRLTQVAQSLTATTGNEHLIVTVDAGNEPALRTYAACGFLEYDRRWLFLKSFGRETPTAWSRHSS